ncbi:MAG: guanylate kinase [Chitinophagaceae bacterium]
MGPDSERKRIIIITAPSGSGKSTIVRHLLQTLPELRFSVSACTRSPRQGEIHGRDYFFISVEEFQQKLSEEAFAEYEMVYAGKYYGTLKSELQKIWRSGGYPLADIDVQGALRLKNYFADKALSIFIKAPALEILEQRLRKRGTETEESLRERLQKAEQELQWSNSFDALIVNDQLDEACQQTEQLIRNFLPKGLSV